MHHLWPPAQGWPGDVYVRPLSCIEMIRTGTTCCVDHISQDIARARISGEGLLCRMVSDAHDQRQAYSSLPTN